MKKLFEVASNLVTKDNKYTAKIQAPQYVPSNECPPLSSLFDYGKYSKLLATINKSSVSEEEKKFLRFAATRHLVFNYSKIADYYAHATPEMQELMEQSALVILDMDDAIANGYVKLSARIQEIMEQSGEDTNEK